MFLAALMIEQVMVDKQFVEQTCRALRDAISRLMVMKESSPLARSGLDILTRCSDRISQLYKTDQNGFNANPPLPIFVSQNDPRSGVAYFNDPSLLEISSFIHDDTDANHYDRSNFYSETFPGRDQVILPNHSENFSTNMSYFDALEDIYATEPMSETVRKYLLG